MRFAMVCFAAACFGQSTNPLILENALVRVVKAANVPSQKSRPHVHLVNRVMVHLDKGALRIDNMETGPRDIPFRAGEVRWDPKVGLHTSENIGGTAIRIVEVELKNDPPPAHPAALRKDVLTKTRGQFQLELENAQARVLRLRLAAQGRTPKLPLERPALLISLRDGATTWEQPGPWRLQNPEAAAAEWILVEIKQ